MKKLLALPVLGAAAALTFGAASALQFGSDNAAIQSGATYDVSCANSAVVKGWGYESDTNLVSNVRLGLVNGEDCDGAEVFVTVYGAGPDEGTKLASGKLASIGDPENFTVQFTPSLDPADIYGVRVTIHGPKG